ncbi:MAG: putative selenium-dependent hydroxylase accessory protein YqeC [Clostridia bacterium]|nr:putative selenium-dependent hydroxylase accessory protein YqeC [Clostridia bacterium]
MSSKKMTSRAYWRCADAWLSGSAADYFPFFDGEKHVISLVGGGGKSTLLEYLAACFAARGLRAAVMTTTHMVCPERVCRSMEDCRICWARGEYAACGTRTENGKFRAPEDMLLRALLDEADAVIVEADGSRRLACKAPAEHEPVILPESDIVIGVMGLEVMGGVVGKVCHRPEHVCALLGCGEDHLLTAADMADILVSEKGTRKGVGARGFYAVLNKCDDEKRLQDGMKVLDELKKRGHMKAVLTSFV